LWTCTKNPFFPLSVSFFGTVACAQLALFCWVTGWAIVGKGGSGGKEMVAERNVAEETGLAAKVEGELVAAFAEGE